MWPLLKDAHVIALRYLGIVLSFLFLLKVQVAENKSGKNFL